MQLLAVLLLDCPDRPDLAALEEQAVGCYKAVVQVCYILAVVLSSSCRPNVVYLSVDRPACTAFEKLLWVCVD
jgi:hypothetical protein